MTGAEAPARRLAIASVAIDALGSLRSTPIGLAALAGLGSGGDFRAIAAAALLGLAISVAMPWLQWRAFTYRIGADSLLIEQGLLSRSRREIPLERIQDVSIEQGVLARMLGLAKVRIETGGGQADEGVLDSVTLAEAARLRALLRSGGVAGDAIASIVEPEETLIFAMPLGRVLLLGLFGFSLMWIALLGVAFRFVDDLIRIDLDELVEAAGREVIAHSTIGTVLAFVAIAVLLGILAGVVRAVVRDYGFRLSLRDGRFRCTRGLFARSETVFGIRRIQLAIRRRGWMMRLLGWCALEFQTLGGSDGPTGRQQAAPLARPEEAARIIALAGLPSLDPGRMAPVSPRHGLRLALRYGATVAVAAALAAWLVPWGALLFALLAPAIWLAASQRRRHCFALDGASLQVTRGALTERAWIVPRDSVQVVVLRRSWLQRRLGLASVHVDTAGARGGQRPHVLDLGESDAQRLARELVAEA